MQHAPGPTSLHAPTLSRDPVSPRRAMRAAALAWICLASTAFGLIPEEAAILQREEILKAVEEARESSPEDVDRQREENREERNRQIREEMSRPPADFAHFNQPRNSSARRQAKRRIQETSSAEAAVSDKPPLLSPLPSIIGLTLFAGVLALYPLLSRQRRNNPSKAKGTEGSF